MCLHEVVGPAIEGSLHGGIVYFAIVIAGDGQNGDGVGGAGFVELGVVVLMHAGEIDDVAYVIAELGRRWIGGAELGDHLIGDVGLKLASCTPPESPKMWRVISLAELMFLAMSGKLSVRE